MSSRRPGSSFANVVSHLGVMIGVAALMGALVAGLAIPFAAVAGFGLRECWVIGWRGAHIDADDAQALWRRLGLVEVRHDVAGGSDIEPDRALLDEAGPVDRAVVLVVEGWEAPDKATRRFVQALRAHGAADRPIFVVVLVPRADAPELGVWRDRMRLLEDPFVSVQPLVAAREPARATGVE